MENWNKFVSQATNGLRLVLILVGVVAGWFFAMNQISELSKVSRENQKSAFQETATQECMEYRIPDAIYFEGKSYCIVQGKGYRLAVDIDTIREALGTP